MGNNLPDALLSNENNYFAPLLKPWCLFIIFLKRKQLRYAFFDGVMTWYGESFVFFCQPGDFDVFNAPLHSEKKHKASAQLICSGRNIFFTIYNIQRGTKPHPKYVVVALIICASANTYHNLCLKIRQKCAQRRERDEKCILFSYTSRVLIELLYMHRKGKKYQKMGSFENGRNLSGI